MDEERTSRRGFVRRLGTTLAVGLGVGLGGAGNAFGINVKCCHTTACDTECRQFGLPPNGYFCGNPCGGCCSCENIVTSCITYAHCPC